MSVVLPTDYVDYTDYTNDQTEAGDLMLVGFSSLPIVAHLPETSQGCSGQLS
jgi:hypothetical protein